MVLDLTQVDLESRSWEVFVCEFEKKKCSSWPRTRAKNVNHNNALRRSHNSTLFFLLRRGCVIAPFKVSRCINKCRTFFGTAQGRESLGSGFCWCLRNFELCRLPLLVHHQNLNRCLRIRITQANNAVWKFVFIGWISIHFQTFDSFKHFRCSIAEKKTYIKREFSSNLFPFAVHLRLLLRFNFFLLLPRLRPYPLADKRKKTNESHVPFTSRSQSRTHCSCLNRFPSNLEFSQFFSSFFVFFSRRG